MSKKKIDSSVIVGTELDDVQFDITVVDDRIGKHYIHFLSGDVFEYLGAETTGGTDAKLMVQYRNIASKETHTCPWNEFFSMTGSDAEPRTPRFKEIIKEEP